jgi:excisionase family DNA binding protein
MSSKRKYELWPVAVSIHRAADVLSVREEKIREAVRKNWLPAYRNGTQTRVLTEDLVRMVREHWVRIKPTEGLSP